MEDSSKYCMAYCVVLSAKFSVVSLSGRGGGLRFRRPPLYRPPYRGREPLSPGGPDPARVQNAWPDETGQTGGG